MVADPLNVSFVRANRDRKVRRVFLYRTFRGSSHPFLDFRMAVGKGKTASPIMRRTRKITPTCIFHWVARGAKNEKSVVDAVGMFIQENVTVRRISKVAQFPELLPLRIDVGATAVTAISSVANKCIHRVTADPWPLPTD